MFALRNVTFHCTVSFLFVEDELIFPSVQSKLIYLTSVITLQQDKYIFLCLSLLHPVSQTFIYEDELFVTILGPAAHSSNKGRVASEERVHSAELR